MEKITKEKALELHKKMWEWIHQVECLGGKHWEIAKTKVIPRASLKEQFLEKEGYDQVFHNCFLCEYAAQQLELREGKSVYDNLLKGEHCKYCPVKWNCNQDKFMCEPEDNPDAYHWWSSDAYEIAHLAEREDVV